MILIGGGARFVRWGHSDWYLVSEWDNMRLVPASDAGNKRRWMGVGSVVTGTWSVGGIGWFPPQMQDRGHGQEL